MSRIETLKEQFPHLNISLLDLLVEIDGTKSHKYVQFLCKIFGKSHSFTDFDLGQNPYFGEDVTNSVERYGLDVTENMNLNYIKTRFLEMFYRPEDINAFQKFKDYLDRGLLAEKDITKYHSFDEILQAISLCEIKLIDKDLQKQAYKEYEDDKWIMVRPLSFQASIKYGAGTKWCTTFEKEKNYFFKYFYNGALVYIIDKTTGYKVAFHGESGKEKLTDISFWGADDKRYDFVDLDLDENILPEIRRIIKGNKTNSKFLEPLELFEVASYCNAIDRLFNSEALSPQPLGSEPLVRDEVYALREDIPVPEPVPNMRA